MDSVPITNLTSSHQWEVQNGFYAGNKSHIITSMGNMKWIVWRQKISHYHSNGEYEMDFVAATSLTLSQQWGIRNGLCANNTCHIITSMWNTK